MTDGKSIIDLHNELNAMPEYILENKLRTLELSLYVFNKNYFELNKLLNVYKDTQKALTLWEETNRHVQDAFHLEITRLFHNFVTSVKSLIAHTRIIYRDVYGENNKFPEYQQEVNKLFAQNPLAQFIEDVRDYCLHYSHLPIYSEMNYVVSPPKFESIIRLSVEIIKKYSNWSPLGKQYLETQKEDTDVTALVAEYYNLATNFHKWMQSCQLQIHREEFAKLNKKKKELAELIVPDEIKYSLSTMEQYEVNPDKAFY
jgi:hypothetical protein